MVATDLNQIILLSRGFSLLEISMEFGESLSTTKRRQSLLLALYGVRNGVALVATALRSGDIV